MGSSVFVVAYEIFSCGMWNHQSSLGHANSFFFFFFEGLEKEFYLFF